MNEHPLARSLRDRGHDVVVIAGSSYEGLSDVDVMEFGRSQSRAVVTNNVGDFRPLGTKRRLAREARATLAWCSWRAVTAARGPTSMSRRRARNQARRVPGLGDIADGETWL